MKLIKTQGTINGLPCEIGLDVDGLASAFANAVPLDLNQKDAAKFCQVSRQTFRLWRVPKNKNGRYSVEALKQRME